MGKLARTCAVQCIIQHSQACTNGAKQRDDNRHIQQKIECEVQSLCFRQNCERVNDAKQVKVRRELSQKFSAMS